MLEEKFAMVAADIVRAFNQLRINDSEIQEQIDWIENLEKLRDFQTKQLADSNDKVSNMTAG